MERRGGRVNSAGRSGDAAEEAELRSRRLGRLGNFVEGSADIEAERIECVHRGFEVGQGDAPHGHAVDTIVGKTGRTREDAMAALVKSNPMRRLIAPDEVAEALLWLASDGAGSVNGQAIALDGGETA